jgi:hypothetical protein
MDVIIMVVGKTNYDAQRLSISPQDFGLEARLKNGQQ